MIQFPNVSPVAFQIGSFAVYWYGLSYVCAFLGGMALAVRRGRTRGWDFNQVSDLVFFFGVGVILGGRFGFVLFYDPASLLSEPLALFNLRAPGRSFHGGLVGVLVAMVWLARRERRTIIEVTDFLAPVVPIGLGFGRLGNFINAELVGRATSVPWGVVFPGEILARHPSQLYEALLEGVGLLCVLLWYARKPRAPGRVSGLFLLGYGAARALVECFRAPDTSHGFVAFDMLTMGQLLSIPMLIGGMWLLLRTPRVTAPMRG